MSVIIRIEIAQFISTTKYIYLLLSLNIGNNVLRIYLYLIIIFYLLFNEDMLLVIYIKKNIFDFSLNRTYILYIEYKSLFHNL